MPKIRHRKIYDDDGEEMLEGAEVIVNGEFERIIHFNDTGEIVLSDWEDDDFIFSIRKKKRDDRYDDIDDPTIEAIDNNAPRPSTLKTSLRNDHG